MSNNTTTVPFSWLLALILFLVLEAFTVWNLVDNSINKLQATMDANTLMYVQKIDNIQKKLSTIERAVAPPSEPILSDKQ